MSDLANATSSELPVDPILDRLPIGVYRTDASGDAIWVNARWAELTGISGSLATGDGWKRALHPEDRENVQNAWALAVETRSPFKMKFRFASPERKAIWVLSRAQPEFDQSGQFTGFVGSIEDITSIMQVGSRLRSALDDAARQKFALDQHAIVAITDVHGDIMYANDRFCQISGYAREELMGHNHRILNSGTHPKSFFAAMYRKITRGEVWQGEICNRAKDGRLYWVATTIVPFVDGEGRIEQYVAIRSDITAHKQATDALRASRERLQTIFGSMSEGLILRDAALNLLESNPAAERILGGKPSLTGARGEDFPGAIREDGTPLRHEDLPTTYTARTGLPTRNVILGVARADGKTTWLSVNTELAPVGETTTERGVICSFFDITEVRRHQEERQRIERKLTESQRLESLGVLAGGIAHDFNNLLTGIMANNALALEMIPAGTPLHPCLVGIEESAQRASVLIKQMLAYSGRSRFVIQRLDLGPIVEETTRFLHHSLPRRAILSKTLDPNVPKISADAGQIRQVIMNIVMNAAEAIDPATGGRIDVSVSQIHADAELLSTTVLGSEVSPGDYVLLEVRDTGVGMPAENLSRMFEPFFTTKFTGRGLGLAAALGIVRGHKGTIKVESEEGKGTRVSVYLPATTGVIDDLPNSNSPFEKWTGSGVALVVDDEEAVRNAMGRLMEMLGFKVEFAKDGQDAVTQFTANTERYKVILLDLTMPRMDGAQALFELRRLSPSQPIVLMSGFSEHEAFSQISASQVDGFIQKPFQLAQLRKVLHHALTASSRTRTPFPVTEENSG